MADNTHSHQNRPKQPETRKRHQPNEDEVDEASMESFPASDSPGWTASTGVHKNPKKTGNPSQNSKDKH